MVVFSLIGTWINGCVNNREADDLRHHRAHYDVSVMDSVYNNLPTSAEIAVEMDGQWKQEVNDAKTNILLLKINSHYILPMKYVLTSRYLFVELYRLTSAATINLNLTKLLMQISMPIMNII